MDFAASGRLEPTAAGWEQAIAEAPDLPAVFLVETRRRYGEAIEQCRKTLALNPGFYRAWALLGRIYAAQGRHSEAIAACSKARELSDGAAFLPFMLGTLGFSSAVSGDDAGGRGVLEELARLEARAVTAHERAIVRTALGEWDAAVLDIEAAQEQGTGWAAWVPFEPLFDLLRAQRSLPAFRSRERSRVTHA